LIFEIFNKNSFTASEAVKAAYPQPQQLHYLSKINGLQPWDVSGKIMP
jgi:hypothetical protein